YFHAVRPLSHAKYAIRPMQIWNGAWLSLALCSCWILLRMLRLNFLWSAAVTLAFAGNYCSLHLATDPFNYYRTPSLALMLAGLICARKAGDKSANRQATSEPDWRLWSATLILLTLA